MELEELSVVEKAAMLSGGSEWDSRGNDRADIPSFVMSDGPHGVRRQLGEGDHLGVDSGIPRLSRADQIELSGGLRYVSGGVSPLPEDEERRTAAARDGSYRAGHCRTVWVRQRQ